MKKITSFLLINLFIFNLFSQSDQQLSSLNLMPWPNAIELNESFFIIDETFNIHVKTNAEIHPKIYNASNRFLKNVVDKTGIFIDQGFVNTSETNNTPSLLITLEAVSGIELGVDESYELAITDATINLNAKTEVGAMHGLNTLLQLLTVREGNYIFPALKINDSPRFPWRGLMIDAARHFMPVEVLKRNLDAMAYVKLNVFHWHLSDDQGFRVESKKLPNLTKKGSDGQFYTQNQIREIVSYAADRGIRVIPEIDVPGHATAIVTAYPEIASKDTIYQIERYSGIFNPTLDPSNESTYEIIDTLFGEITPLFPDVFFHIGGDENAGKHWDENEAIQKFMRQNKLEDNHALQTYFNVRLEKILRKYNKQLMGWDEIMTPNMPNTALIHSWRGKHEGLSQSTLIEAAKKGYKTVLSNGFYIDRMLPASHYYLTEPIGDAVLTEAERHRILGGEATMWSELVTPLNIDSRIWPRTAAIAERFWSVKERNDVDDMYRRLEVISNGLEQMGLTHIRNKEVILRNVSNYQSINSLVQLSNISEPFKVYSRNDGGKQYKTYAPFTLFADACNVDAEDAIYFSSLCYNYISNKDASLKNEILAYLKSWIAIEKELEILQKNAPLITRVLPYAKRLANISIILEIGLLEENLNENQYRQIVTLLEQKEDPDVNLDVELAVTEALKDLSGFLLKK